MKYRPLREVDTRFYDQKGSHHESEMAALRLEIKRLRIELQDREPSLNRHLTPGRYYYINLDGDCRQHCLECEEQATRQLCQHLRTPFNGPDLSAQIGFYCGKHGYVIPLEPAIARKTSAQAVRRPK